MTAKKKAWFTVRIPLHAKGAIEKAAKSNQRSMNNFVLVAVEDYCKRSGIPWPSAPEPNGPGLWLESVRGLRRGAEQGQALRQSPEATSLPPVAPSDEC